MSKKGSLDFQAYSNQLKERINFYREENARLRETLRNINILNDDYTMRDDIMEKVSKVTNHLENTVATEQNVNKYPAYFAKLKLGIRIYVKINQKLSEDIQEAKREHKRFNENMSKILTVDSTEILKLKEKALKYEKELKKFENRYPWLKDPTFYLPNIKKSADKLRSLRQTKECLESELSKYQGLKPDISEATKQLADLKEEINNCKIYLVE